MKIPHTEYSLALRTDFSDEAAWESVRAAILQPSDGSGARVDFISDPEFAGVDDQHLLAVLSDGPYRSHAFIIDRVALTHAESAVQVVDLLREPGRAFRVIPCEVAAVADNLQLANMDFCDFADAVDEDGIFRGFPKTPQRLPPPPTKESFWKRLFK